MADVFVCNILPLLVADQVEASVYGRIGLFEHHIHLGGELHISHNGPYPVHGAHTGAIAHELQADFLKMAALGGHGRCFGMEDLAVAMIHIKADPSDHLALVIGKELKDIDTAQKPDAQLQRKASQLLTDMDGYTAHIQCVRNKGQRRRLALLIAGGNHPAMLHVVNVISMYLQIPLQEFLVIHKWSVGMYQVFQCIHYPVRMLRGCTDAVIHHQNIQAGVIFLCPDRGNQAGHAAAHNQNVGGIKLPILFYTCHLTFLPPSHPWLPVLHCTPGDPP